MSATDISNDGLTFIANEEGEVKKNGLHVLYNDPLGFATIGWGHLIHHSPIDNCSTCNSFRPGLTDEQALALKKQDAQRFVRALREQIEVPLNQNQFDALVSLMFNIGEGKGGFLTSTLRTKLNGGDYAGAAEEFLKWNKGTLNGQLVVLPGLTSRRKREKQLFLTSSKTNEREYEAVKSILSLNSGYVLDISGNSMDDRGAVIQWEPTGKKNQSVVFEPEGNGLTRIKFEHSGKYLDADPGRLEVVQFGRADVPGQLWKIKELNQGGLVIQANDGTSRVLDVSGVSKEQGAAIILWEPTGAPNQTFAEVNFQ